MMEKTEKLFLDLVLLFMFLAILLALLNDYYIESEMEYMCHAHGLNYVKENSKIFYCYTDKVTVTEKYILKENSYALLKRAVSFVRID